MKLEIHAVSGSVYYTWNYENATSFCADMTFKLEYSAPFWVQNIFGDEVFLMPSAIESVREVNE